MNRRQFSKNIGLGALGAAALSVSGKVATLDAATGAKRAKTPKVSSPAKSEKKEWAHEYLKGLTGVISPSFTPDFKNLDEDGIRLDVQHFRKQGFIAGETFWPLGQTKEQSERMKEILTEETRDNPKYAEASKYKLVGYPRDLKPESEDDVYKYFHQVADSSSDVVILYGTPVESLRQFHPSGIPLNVFDRIADHPNVVGIKLTQPMDVPTAFALTDRLSDRLIINAVNLDLVPILAKHYDNVQWSSIWITDSIQSPEKPYGVEFMDLIAKKDIDKAMKVYYQMQSLVTGINELQGRLILLHDGLHPTSYYKYMQWVTGGNGGLIPIKPVPFMPTLDAAGRELVKNNFKKAGITPVDRPEEEFIVGRAAYAKGVRASQFTDKPYYA